MWPHAPGYAALCLQGSCAVQAGQCFLFAHGRLDEDGGDIFVDAGTDYKLQTQPRGDARHQDGPYFSHPSELASALPGPPAGHPS